MGVEGSPEEQQRAWKPQWGWIVDGPEARRDGKCFLLPPKGEQKMGKVEIVLAVLSRSRLGNKFQSLEV